MLFVVAVVVLILKFVFADENDLWLWAKPWNSIDSGLSFSFFLVLPYIFVCKWLTGNKEGFKDRFEIYAQLQPTCLFSNWRSHYGCSRSSAARSSSSCVFSVWTCQGLAYRQPPLGMRCSSSLSTLSLAQKTCL